MSAFLEGDEVDLRVCWTGINIRCILSVILQWQKGVDYRYAPLKHLAMRPVLIPKVRLISNSASMVAVD